MSKAHKLARKYCFIFSKNITVFLCSKYFIVIDDNKNIDGLCCSPSGLDFEQLQKDIIELKASL